MTYLITSTSTLVGNIIWQSCMRRGKQNTQRVREGRVSISISTIFFVLNKEMKAPPKTRTKT
jgi:hypothetical protein